MKNLSPKENTILNMCANGNNVRQIAKILEISEHTVKTYKERILLKLDANHICHAVAIYARRGLLK